MRLWPMKNHARRTWRPRRLDSEVDIPMSAIRRFARQVADQFRPDKIILFGSHAYGKPRADSDVDLLVVMPTRSQIDQAAQIRLAITAPFPMDLLVRTPDKLRKGLAQRSSFLREIVAKGKVLYEKGNGALGAKRRGRLRRRPQARSRQRAPA